MERADNGSGWVAASTCVKGACSLTCDLGSASDRSGQFVSEKSIN
jgi:hypothetical protein